MGILSWILVGLIAGWFASLIVGKRRGLISSIVLGIIGALVGGFIMDFLGYGGVDGLSIHSIVVAIFGAVLVVWVGKIIVK